MVRSAPSRARRILTVILLWGAGLAAAGQFAKIAIPFAEIRLLYPDAHEAAGWLLSLVSLVGAALGVVAGRIAARLGAGRLLLAGLGLGAALSAWQATGPSFAAMLVSRGMEGVSHLAIVVAAPVLIARIAPASLTGAAMALWSTFFGVTFAATAWFGLPFVAAFGIAPFIALHAAATLLIGLTLVPVLGGHGALDRPDPTERRPADGIVSLHLRAYRTPRIAAPGIGWLFYTLTFVALIAILPDRLPPEMRIRVAGWMPLIAIVVSLAAVPPLLRVTRATRVVVAGFALAVATLCLILAGAPLLPVALGLFAALGLVQGASFAAVTELNEMAEDRALGYGLIAQTGNIGNLLGTPLLLAVSGRGGESGLVLAVGAIYLTAIAAFIALQR